MGSLGDLQKLLKLKDTRITELEQQLRDKDDLVQELRSQLDKYQSILPKSPTVRNGPRKQRAQGISAEPQGRYGATGVSDIKEHEKYAKSP